MTMNADEFFELSLVSRILGDSVEQIEHLCRLLGITPTRRDGEDVVGRDAVRRLYHALNTSLVPREAA